MDFEKYNLPVTNIKQLELLFAELILWYDEGYCKTIDGANEVIGQYMKECEGKKDKTSTESVACSNWIPSKATSATRCATCGRDRWEHEL